MNWILNNVSTITDATWAHLWLALPAIVLSFVVAIPVAWFASRFRHSRFTLLLVAGLIYAIPSLPLFIVLPLILGTSVRSLVNVVAALGLYGVALMVRYAADALDAVSSDALLAATAMGYGPLKRFFGVQLPLAGPALLAGLRVVAVSTVSLVPVSALLGVNSLGMLLTDGFQRGILAEVASGIGATVVVAVAVDLGLVGLGRLLMPWERVAARRDAGRPTVEDDQVVAA
ncbi:MAG TPA: ABC transporter permease subunit [Propionibacteriaceae bacterium]